MPKRKSMSGTAPRGVDAYFPDSPAAPQPVAPTNQESEESIKTTVYITPEQRDYIDELRFKLRREKPGLTRSAVIRLALDQLAQMDEQVVSSAILSHHDSVMA
jgi:hypothetical protein